jgi:RNA polymerase sigma factor (sigma-70 family)
VWGPSGLQGRTYAKSIEKLRELLRRRSSKRGSDTIEDRIQRTLVKLTDWAEQKPEKFAGPKTLGSLALGVYHLLKLADHRKGKQRREAEENWGTELQAPPRRSMEPDASLEEEETQSLANQILARLTPMQARVMHELKVKKLSYREAAEVLDVSVSTIRLHAVEARKRCRQEARALGLHPPEKRSDGGYPEGGAPATEAKNAS